MSNVETDESRDGVMTITLSEVDRLHKVEDVAREAARYHVRGYGGDSADWDANQMLALMDKLAKVLNE